MDAMIESMKRSDIYTHIYKYPAEADHFLEDVKNQMYDVLFVDYHVNGSYRNGADLMLEILLSIKTAPRVFIMSAHDADWCNHRGIIPKHLIDHELPKIFNDKDYKYLGMEQERNIAYLSKYTLPKRAEDGQREPRIITKKMG